MSDTATPATSAIVWFEVPAQDTARARGFYAQLLGWQFEAFGADDYHVTQDGGGAVHHAPEQKGMLAYFGVTDVDAEVRRVRDLAGDASDTQEIPGIGLYAHCADTEGNTFGLYEHGGSK